MIIDIWSLASFSSTYHFRFVNCDSVNMVNCVIYYAIFICWYLNLKFLLKWLLRRYVVVNRGENRFFFPVWCSINLIEFRAFYWKFGLNCIKKMQWIWANWWNKKMWSRTLLILYSSTCPLVFTIGMNIALLFHYPSLKSVTVCFPVAFWSLKSNKEVVCSLIGRGSKQCCVVSWIIVLL